MDVQIVLSMICFASGGVLLAHGSHTGEIAGSMDQKTKSRSMAL
jgi:hypothetical protein